MRFPESYFLFEGWKTISLKSIIVAKNIEANEMRSLLVIIGEFSKYLVLNYKLFFENSNTGEWNTKIMSG